MSGSCRIYCPACNVELVATCKSSLVLTVLEVVAEVAESAAPAKRIEAIIAEYWGRKRLAAAMGTACSAEAAKETVDSTQEEVTEDWVLEGSLAGFFGVCF